MEKSTTLGMTLGLFAVGYGMYLKGADPHALINPAAFLIIFAGTFAALLNAFPMKDIKRFGKLLKIIFTGKKITSKQEILELFVSLAKSAKSEGVMGIEKKANEVEDPFIRSTLILVADGFPRFYCRNGRIRNQADGRTSSFRRRHFRAGRHVCADAGRSRCRYRPDCRSGQPFRY